MERVKQYVADRIATAEKYTKYKFNKFIKWLFEYVPPKPKVIDTAFEHVKKSIIELFPNFQRRGVLYSKGNQVCFKQIYHTVHNSWQR